MLDFRTTKGLRFVNDGARATYVFANHFPISEDYQAKWRRRIRKLLLNADTLERYVRLRRDPFQTDRLVTVGDEDRTSFHKLVSLRGTRIARAIIRALQSSEVSFGDASKNNRRNVWAEIVSQSVNLERLKVELENLNLAMGEFGLDRLAFEYEHAIRMCRPPVAEVATSEPELHETTSHDLGNAEDLVFHSASFTVQCDDMDEAERFASMVENGTLAVQLAEDEPNKDHEFRLPGEIVNKYRIAGDAAFRKAIERWRNDNPRENGRGWRPSAKRDDWNEFKPSAIAQLIAEHA